MPVPDIAKVIDFSAVSWYNGLVQWRFAPMPHYKLTPVEAQSKLTRVRCAELLIEQLPIDHDGASTWLMNYGIGDRAKALRARRNIQFIRETQAAETV